MKMLDISIGKDTEKLEICMICSTTQKYNSFKYIFEITKIQDLRMSNRHRAMHPPITDTTGDRDIVTTPTFFGKQGIENINKGLTRLSETATIML